MSFTIHPCYRSAFVQDAKLQETSLEHVVILGLDVTVRIELYLVTVIVTWVLESRRFQIVVYPPGVSCKWLIAITAYDLFCDQ